jgi:nitrogenase subunit NifH
VKAKVTTAVAGLEREFLPGDVVEDDLAPDLVAAGFAIPVRDTHSAPAFETATAQRKALPK